MDFEESIFPFITASLVFKKQHRMEGAGGKLRQEKVKSGGVL